MATQIIPLTSDPNQQFQITLSVDDSNRTLSFSLSYNEMAEYWIMAITDPAMNTVLLDSIPLVPGDYPAANILSQYAYFGIGSAYVIKASENTQDIPGANNLGTDFLLVWSDTV